MRGVTVCAREVWHQIVRKQEKTSESCIFEVLHSWYILSWKPSGNGVYYNRIHFNSVSCLLIILNHGEEFSSYVIIATD